VIDFREASNLIDKAIRAKKDLWIRYRDMSLNLADEVITPLEWIGEERSLFKAFCHLHNEERLFNIFSISDIKLQDRNLNRIEDLEEIQPFRAVPVFVRPQPHSLVSTGQSLLPAPAFSTLNSPNEWQRLIRYYCDCLHERSRQDFQFPRTDLYLLAIDRQQAFEFLQGDIDLQITVNYQYWHKSLQQFLDPALHKNQQLCLGVSFFFDDAGQISPLLFTPIDLEFPEGRQTILKPGYYAVNYAPLAHSRHAQKEIANFLDAYGQWLQEHPTLADSEQFLVSEFSHHLGRPVNVYSSSTNSMETVPEFSVYDGIGLFWIEKQESENPLEDLTYLAQESHWNSAPDILLSLLNQKIIGTPTPLFNSEATYFMHPKLRPAQESAALIALYRPVTVVSGLPGTGKSTLVINLLLQAFLENKKVLVVVPEEQQIDDFIHQIEEEIHFPLVLQTGNPSADLRTAEEIEQLLSVPGNFDLNEEQGRFREARQKLQEAISQLDAVRRLNSVLKAYLLDQNALEKALPSWMREQILQLELPEDKEEKQAFEKVLADLEDQVRSLVLNRGAFQKEILAALTQPESQAVIARLLLPGPDPQNQTFLEQLYPKKINRLEDIQAWLDRWTDLIDSLAAQKGLNAVTAQLPVIEEKSRTALEKLNDHQRQHAVTLANSLSKNDLVRLRKRFSSVLNGLEKHAKNNYRWSEKFLIELQMMNPESQIERHLYELLIQVGREIEAKELPRLTTQHQIDLCKETIALLRTAILLQKLKDDNHTRATVLSEFKKAAANLPEVLLERIKEIDLSDYTAPADLREQLIRRKEGLRPLYEQRHKANLKAAQEIGANAQQLQLLERVKEQLSESGQNLFQIPEDLFEDRMEQYLRLWRKILEICAVRRALKDGIAETAQAPSEEDALESYRCANRDFMTATQHLLQATWRQRLELSAKALPEVDRYVHAVQQAARSTDGRDPRLYQKAKDIQRETFPWALSCFPVWGIALHSSQNHLPVNSEMFDLIIFDDAHEMDVPSAIPLLYRAKKVLITGSPQNRQTFVTFDPRVNDRLALEHGADLNRYSFNANSLFALAQKSIRETPLILDEHMRSDPRIISFINRECFSDPMRIQTDLTKRGFSKETINRQGGLYWVNVPGAYRQLQHKNADNPAEIEVIQKLLFQLNQLQSPNQFTTLPSIGVISLFQAQEVQIRGWIQEAFPNTQRIQSGLPMDFKGKEFDIVVFSPVLANGAAEDLLAWLEEVGMTIEEVFSKARFCQIIVGDWAYFNQQFPEDHPYHRLTDYVQNTINGLRTSINDLPLFGGAESEKPLLLPDPADAEHTCTTMEQILLGCQDHIDWITPQLNQQDILLLDKILLWDRSARIRTVRLITNESQITAEPPEIDLEKLQKLCAYLIQRSIQMELRVLPDKKIPPENTLYHAGGAVPLPQKAKVLQGLVLGNFFSQKRADHSEFEKYWAAASEEILKRTGDEG
jgi:hypothetical protein